MLFPHFLTKLGLFSNSYKLRITLTCICILVLTACSPSKRKYLETVDRSLKEADYYQEKARLEAERSFNNGMKNHVSHEDQLRVLIKASDDWLPLDLEKSLRYLQRARTVASRTEDSLPNISEVNLRLASLYNSQGSMLKEAAEIFNAFNPDILPDSLRERYYILGVQLNRSLAERAFDEDLKILYSKKAAAYRDSVLLLNTNSTIIAVNKLIEAKKFNEALDLLRSDKPDKPKFARDMAPYYHYMAEIFSYLEKPDSQIYYLALSATADLQNGVREYKALPELAELLKETDIYRAYQYINRSVIDANGSHSELRQKELAGAFREIQANYNAYQSRQKLWIIQLLILTLIVAIIIVISFVLLRAKNKKLNEYAEVITNAKKELENTNDKLKQLNEALLEQSRVKEHYVKSFMELSLSYLAQMERFRAEIAKFAAKGDWKTLTNRINSSRYVNREVQEFFENFDNAFLSIYPDYIFSLNRLLKPEERYGLERKSLTTELRIYALIRLGVTESNQIAKFLRCSESTVYNYRTKMRNRAVNREEFECEFMNEVM